MIATRILATTVLAAGLLAGCADAKTAVAVSGGNVPVGAFKSVELRGGGHVTISYGAAERVTLINGSTQYTHFRIEDGNKLVIDACNEHCPEHYDLSIEIVMPRVSGVAIDGGGRVETAAGFPSQDRIAAAVHGGGDIDVRSVDAKNAEAAVDGGGKIRLHADASLTAAVNGGGAIRYLGAADVTSAINGGGSIERDGG